jgi:hypothetical protein
MAQNQQFVTAGAGSWSDLHNEELHILYASPISIKAITSRAIRWARHITCMGQKRNLQKMACNLVAMPSMNSCGIIFDLPTSQLNCRQQTLAILKLHVSRRLRNNQCRIIQSQSRSSLHWSWSRAQIVYTEQYEDGGSSSMKCLPPSLLVCVRGRTETQCVSCEVGTECWSVIHTHFVLPL